MSVPTRAAAARDRAALARRRRLRRAGPDARGRNSRALEARSGPTIVCVQVGNVNTGASDPVAEIVDAGACVRRLGPRRRGLRPLGGRRRSHRHLVDGVERADSWATDGHKWLNVPYDCGYAFCAHPGRSPGRDDDRGGVPDPVERSGRAARADRLEPGVLPPRARLPDLRGAEGARPRRRLGARRALLRPCAAVRGDCWAPWTASRS